MSFFLVPNIGAGTRADPHRPKYVDERGVMTVLGAKVDNWTTVDFIDTAVVWADTSPAQDAALGADTEVRVIPPLDDTIAVNATKQELEDMGMPAQWVTAGMTYRTVLRFVVGMAQLLQRASTIFGSSISPAGKLDLTLGSLSQTLRDALAQACDEFGINRTGMVGSTTLREALRDFGQQFVTRGVHIGDL
jgi:hypothetical protein